MRPTFRTLTALPLLVLGTGCSVDASDPVATASDPQALVFEPLLSPGQGGFAPGARVLTGFCNSFAASCTTIDVNGDHRADFISFSPIFLLSGARYTSISVSLANADGTWATPRSFGSYSSTSASPEVGDVNGDGRDDLVLFAKSTGDVSVMLSNGAGFAAPVRFLTGFCRTNETCKTGDFDGDGKADVARFLLDTVTGAAAGDVHVALSTGSGFGAPTLWATDLGHAGDVIEIGDTDGDGKDDVVRFLKRDALSNPMFIARSNGTSFLAQQQLLNDFCAPGLTCKVGNIDGGARADVVAFVSSLREGEAAPDVRNDVYASLAQPALSGAVAYGPTRVRGDNFCPKNWACTLADVDADGKDDLVAFSRSDSAAPGVVRIAKSTFGRRSNYTIDHTRMTALATEGTSDKPLLINIAFRSRFGVRGSSTVFSTTYNETWGTGLAVGEWRAVPNSVGDAAFTGLASPTIDEIATRRGQMDVIGSLVIAVEKDLSAADSWRALTEEAKVALAGILAETVEITRPIELAFNPTVFRDRLTAAANGAKDRVVPMIDELIGLYISGLFDPDDVIGFHLYLYPAVDKEAATLFPPSPDPSLVTLAPLGDGAGYWSQYSDFKAGPVHWRLESRPRFVSFAP